MTEYTTSSQAIRDYLSSKERTKHWVLNRAEPPDLCYSPSVAPSVFNGNDNDFVLPPASDTGSSHSLPPKMVLRYSDGRPDEAIPYGQGHGSKLRPSQPRSRSGSGTGPAPPRGPEEIRVLPTSPVDPRPPGPVRSKSLPRSAYSQIQQDHGIPPVPPLPQMHVGFSPTPQPVWNGAQDSHHGHGRHPPAIVYAPSHARSRPHYAPPAIYTHPPQMGPNGMIYSHSAPVRPSQKYVPTPYPSVVPSAHSHMSAVKEEEHRRRSKTPNGRDRSRSRTRRDLSPASSVSSFASNGSGSTYYVMPTGRQKVHVIL
ncbi:hypothetical protein C8F01DRAFT_5269 [Mycena amicta]|nr:hypothetical protein C8F01DRAFT_5269 [Mycena amicta]